MKKIIIGVVFFVVFLMVSGVCYSNSETIWTAKDDVEGTYKKMYYATGKDNTSCAVLVRKDGKFIELVAIDKNHEGKTAINETDIHKDGSWENRTDVIGKDGTFLYPEDNYLIFREKCAPVLNKEVPEKVQKIIKEVLDI